MKITCRELMALAVLAAATLRADGANHYVWAGGSDAPPYETWARAAHKIEAAVAVARNGETVWVTNGTYAVSEEITVGKGITVRSWNGNDGGTIIDGRQATRCVNLIDDRATLDGFVVQNGNDAGRGGGVILSPGSVLANSTLVSNTAAYGGGVCFEGGGCVTNCTIAMNRAIGPSSIYAGGGGVYMVNGGILVACQVYGNNSGPNPGGGINAGIGSVVLGGVVSNNLAGRGGGIYCNGQALVSNVVIVANVCSNGVGGGGGVSLVYGAKLLSSTVGNNKNFDTADGGGGVELETGSQVANCAIYGNDAVNHMGGGVLLGSGSTLAGSTVVSNKAWRGGGVFSAGGQGITNCKIRGNVAVNDWGGGGVFVGDASPLVIRSCLISENECVNDGGSGGGGGVWMTTGCVIDNCTIVRNRARSSGGGVCWNGGTVKNSIICFNTVGSVATNVSAGFTNFFYSCAPDLAGGANGNIVADPAFVAVGSGSGTNAVPGDYVLSSTSPCVGKGHVEDWMTKAVDLAGQPRLDGHRGAVDMGAYEHPFTPAWWKRLRLP